MSSLFSKASMFNQDRSSWNVGNFRHMDRMFFHAYSFNQDIGSWDVSRVIDLGGVHVFLCNFIQSRHRQLYTSRVTDMTSMFSRASSFNQEIGSWDVSSLLRSLGVFSNCYLFSYTVCWTVSARRAAELVGSYPTVSLDTHCPANSSNSPRSSPSSSPSKSASNLAHLDQTV